LHFNNGYLGVSITLSEILFFGRRLLYGLDIDFCCPFTRFLLPLLVCLATGEFNLQSSFRNAIISGPTANELMPLELFG